MNLESPGNFSPKSQPLHLRRSKPAKRQLPYQAKLGIKIPETDITSAEPDARSVSSCVGPVNTPGTLPIISRDLPEQDRVGSSEPVVGSDSPPYPVRAEDARSTQVPGNSVESQAQISPKLSFELIRVAEASDAHDEVVNESGVAGGKREMGPVPLLETETPVGIPRKSELLPVLAAACLIIRWWRKYRSRQKLRFSRVVTRVFGEYLKEKKNTFDFLIN